MSVTVPFGDMHRAIIRSFKIITYLVYRNTNFAANSSGGNPLRTTEQALETSFLLVDAIMLKCTAF